MLESKPSTDAARTEAPNKQNGTSANRTEAPNKQTDGSESKPDTSAIGTQKSTRQCKAMNAEGKWRIACYSGRLVCLLTCLLGKGIGSLI